MITDGRYFSIIPAQKIFFFTLSLLFLSTTGCLRYTSSTPQADSDIVINSDKVFFAKSNAEQARLKQLLMQRSATQNSSDDEYRVGSGDVLDFVVFDIKELNTEVRVRPSGIIHLPLIGSIQASEMTEHEIQEEVARRLKEYVYNPQVSVRIKEYAAHKIAVIGEVERPGSYPLIRNNYNLVELISEAGGRTKSASGTILLLPTRNKFRQFRGRLGPTAPAIQKELLKNSPSDSAGIEILWDDIAGTSGKPAIFIPLKAGDTIVVPEAGTIQVDGDVQKPGTYPLSARTSVLGAVAAAGGLTYSSRTSHVEVIREQANGKKALLVLDMDKLTSGEQKDIRLRNGDVVRIPSSPARFAVRQFVNLFYRMFRFGVSSST